MEIRSTGFRTDLRVLELGGSEVEDRGAHLVVRTPDNPNFYWGNFLLLREPPVPGGEREVVAAFHTEFPGAQHVALGIDGTEDLGDSLEPFVDAGLSVEDATVLTATSLVEPASPGRGGEGADAEEDVEVRPLESDDDWEQRAQLDLVVDDLTPDADVLDFVRNRVASWRRLVDRGHATWWGAFEDGRLLSTCGIVRTSEGGARYQSVASHPHARRRGLAAAVVHAAGSRALADGAHTLVIVAETDGPAMRLYQRLGLTGGERQTQLFRSP